MRVAIISLSRDLSRVCSCRFWDFAVCCKEDSSKTRKSADNFGFLRARNNRAAVFYCESAVRDPTIVHCVKILNLSLWPKLLEATAARVFGPEEKRVAVLFAAL